MLVYSVVTCSFYQNISTSEVNVSISSLQSQIGTYCGKKYTEWCQSATTVSAKTLRVFLYYLACCCTSSSSSQPSYCHFRKLGNDTPLTEYPSESLAHQSPYQDVLERTLDGSVKCDRPVSGMNHTRF